MAVKVERINLAPILVYVSGLVTMLAFSAAYNMWPVSPVKWALRRFDHSAIYLLIAGTYTPFLAQMKTLWSRQVSASASG
jgi:hemolysin III